MCLGTVRGINDRGRATSSRTTHRAIPRHESLDLFIGRKVEAVAFGLHLGHADDPFAASGTGPAAWEAEAGSRDRDFGLG
jgi:hypothetical protein